MRKFAFLVLCLIFWGIVSGCAGGKDLPAKSPEEAALTILKLSSGQKWDELYDYLHKDVKDEYSHREFVRDREKNGKMFALVSNYKIRKTVFLKEWQDKEGTGKTYKNVAEVTCVITLKNGFSFDNVITLAKDDGLWRYFWHPAKRFRIMK